MGFFSLFKNFQIGFGAHQASCSLGTGEEPYPGIRRPEREANSHASSAEIKNDMSYVASYLYAFVAATETTSKLTF
jgi:hypothetical protein